MIDLKVEDNTPQVSLSVSKSGGSSDVTKEYVDIQDIATLNKANTYTDGELGKLPKAPTKTSELENDSGYLTGIPDSYAKVEYVQNECIKTLSTAKIYTDECKYNDTEVRELINTNTRNIASNMANINLKQDKLVAGANITLDGNVISATGGGSSYDDTEVRGLIADNTDNIDALYLKMQNKVDKVVGKGLFSGSYTDLTDKPIIPTTSDIDTSVQDYVQAHQSELKGDKGDKGDSVKGDKGDDGYTPVRTVDYWTDEDKASIVADTKTAIDLSSYAKASTVNANTVAISTKANATDVYTKTEIDTMVGDIETLLGGI